MLCDKSQNLVACDNNIYCLFGSLGLGFRQSTASELSAGRLENRRLESSESSSPLTWALLDLSAGAPTLGLSTGPALLCSTVYGFQGSAGLKSQHRPGHHDASRKVTSTIKSRVSEWEKKRNGNKGDQGEPCLSNTASENQKRQKYNLLPLSYLCIV